MDQPVTVTATITRKRAAFTQYTSTVEADGEVVGQHIMSGTACFTTSLPVPAVPGDLGPGEAIDAGLFARKDPAMCFVDSVLNWDGETGAMACGYTTLRTTHWCRAISRMPR